MDAPTRWAFMRFFTLRDQASGREYLRRLRIVQTPAFSLYLHRLEVPDPGDDLHDHPWWFASLILRGGYDEVIADAREAPSLAKIARLWPETCLCGVPRIWRAGSLHTIRLDWAHRIYRLHRSPTWTLVLTGPRRRSWGFYDAAGFVDHRDYDHPTLRALDEQDGAA